MIWVLLPIVFLVCTWKDLTSKSMLEKALVKNITNKCSFCPSDNGNLCLLEKKSDAIFSLASHIHLEIQANHYINIQKELVLAPMGKTEGKIDLGFKNRPQKLFFVDSSLANF